MKAIGMMRRAKRFYYDYDIDTSAGLQKDKCMNTVDQTADIAQADARAVFDHFSFGTPLDPEIAKRVRERGDNIREEVFQRHGLLDIGVPAIRELRGDLPKS